MIPSDMKPIQHKIKTLRKIKGFTEAEMADKLYMTQSNYSKLELSKTPIDEERLEQIANIFGYSKQELEALDIDQRLDINNNQVQNGAILVHGNLTIKGMEEQDEIVYLKNENSYLRTEVDYLRKELQVMRENTPLQ